MAEWDWRVSWWLFWRVFRVLESSAREHVRKLQINGGRNAVVRYLAQGGRRHTLQRILGLAQAQVSGLLEGGERFIDSGDS